MNQFCQCCALPNMVQFTISMLFQQSTFALPNRLVINIILTRFPIAVGPQNVSYQQESQQDYQQVSHQYNKIQARNSHVCVQKYTQNSQNKYCKQCFDSIHYIGLMWDLLDEWSWNWKLSLPPITITGVATLTVGLLGLRAFLQAILHHYFKIKTRPQHFISTLEYSYFYHLSIVVILLADVDWNMIDLIIWTVSYIGVGLIRKAIYVVKIEKGILLNDFAYSQKLLQILSASQIFGGIVFVITIIYVIYFHLYFNGLALKLTSLILFPTIMLAVDSIFLLISSVVCQQQLVLYFNQNVNKLPSGQNINQTQEIIGNSIRFWHYYNLIRLFLKNFLQKAGFFHYIWFISLVNACFISINSLIGVLNKLRTYRKLLSCVTKILLPAKSAPLQDCVVCMTELLNCRRLATCGHLFHYKCLFSWIQTKKDCPLCRAPIVLTQE